MAGDAWRSAYEPDIQALRRARRIMRSDPAASIKQFEALAARGSMMSMFVVAEALRKGLVYSRDIEKSKEWYEAAIHRGSIHAVHGLAKLYSQQGQYHLARKAFERGAKAGFSPSMNDLAHLYYTGRGGPVDRPKAIALWERASRLGNVCAKRNLGRILSAGQFGRIGKIRGLWLRLEAEADRRLLRTIDRYDDRLG